MNYEVARYSDGITATSHEFALFEGGIPIFPISKDQLKEFKKTETIKGVLEKGNFLVDKFDFDRSINIIVKDNQKVPEVERVLVDSKKIKAGVQSKVKKKIEKINKTSNKKEEVKKCSFENEKNLSADEVNQLLTLSRDQINKFPQKMKSFLKNQLLLIRNSEEKIKGYHAQLLWGLIQDRNIEGVVALGNIELSSQGFSSSVVKKARNELVELGLITCTQEIINSRVRNIYTIL